MAADAIAGQTHVAPQPVSVRQQPPGSGQQRAGGRQVPITVITGQQSGGRRRHLPRWVIKAIRQKAGLLMAADARMAPIAAELRAKCAETLKGPAGHEGNRH